MLAALLVLPACSSDDPEAAAEPAAPTSSAPTPSETAAPTPTPSPTPTARPLSRFEDEPPVKAARAWAAAVALDITAGKAALPRSSKLVAPEARADFRGFATEELGLEYPGPVPFTPLAVDVQGGTAEVTVCLWSAGWGIEPTTGRPAEARLIRPNTFVLRRDGGWKLANLYRAEHDCSGVKVRGVAS